MRYRGINQAADATRTLAVQVQDLRQDVARDPTPARQFALAMAEQDLAEVEREATELFEDALERHLSWR